MHNVQAPISLTPALRKHCDKVSLGFSPTLLDTELRLGARSKTCFQNVQEAVESEGGASEYGWAIYAWPRVWHEFRFHAAWRDRSGQLRDPTPTDDGERVVLFLPSDLSYTGRSLATQLYSLSKSEDVVELIKVHTEISEIEVRFSEERYDGQPFPPTEQDRLQALHHQSAAIRLRMNYQVKPNDLCPCLSRKKFKKCCGRQQRTRRG
jgi:hypothetical protein